MLFLKHTSPTGKERHYDAFLAGLLGGYTVFGRVTSGLDVVEAVAQAGVDGGGSDGAPATPISLEQVSVQ